MKRHAYLILIHEFTEVLETLLCCIDDARNDIFIHVDKKSKGFPREKCEACIRQTRIFWVPQVKVNWGGYSQIKSELSLLEHATGKGQYSYYHLLSGADLPLKSQDEIHAFFEEHDGTEFVGFSDDFSEKERKRVKTYQLFQEFLPRYSDSLPIMLAHRLNSLFLFLQRAVGINRNRDVKFRKGSNWFSITDAMARLVVSKENWIRKTFRFTHCCDEIFLQTILADSEYLDNSYVSEENIHTHMRYIDWKRGKPYIFRTEDFDSLMKSGKLFARKFSADVDADIVRKIRNTVSR